MRELAIFAGAYALYSAGRFVAIGDLDVATGNANAIVDLEQSVGADVEGSVQDAFDGSLALWILNHLYLAAQLIVVPGALVWLYRRSPAGTSPPAGPEPPATPCRARRTRCWSCR